MIYLYGLAEAAADDMRAALDGQLGLQAPLEVTQIEKWVLIHSEQDDVDILPKRRLMLAHTRALESMLTVGAVLPARFGLVADDMGQTRALIEAREPIIAQEFERVRDCIELGVRVKYPRATALEATLQGDASLQTERDALRNRGADAHYAIAAFGGKIADRTDRRRGQAQKVMLDALKDISRDHVLRAPEEDTEVLRAEFLVETALQDKFEKAVETAARTLTFAPGAEPVIQIIGPVPVYNFVRLSLSAPADEAAA